VGHALRILLADDEGDVVATLAELLRARGHTVRTVSDGQSAINVAGDFQPQVSVLDIGMPLMSGHEVARYLRRQPCGRGMLLVALSGWGSKQDRTVAREAGFDYHLTKPADFDHLAELLERQARVPAIREEERNAGDA
jgi:CheY-like chemotaxis protein